MKMINLMVPLVFGALSTAAVNSAIAATTAGTQIKNSATLTYSINGSNQSETEEVTFDVDLKVDFSLGNNSGSILTTALPESATVIEIAQLKLKNESNAKTDFSIDITDKAEDSTATLHGEEYTDTYDLANANFSVVLSSSTATNSTAAASFVNGQIVVTGLEEDEEVSLSIRVAKTAFTGTIDNTTLSIQEFTAKATSASGQGFTNQSIGDSDNNDVAKDNDLDTVQIVFADGVGSNVELGDNSETIAEAIQLELPNFNPDPDPDTGEKGFEKLSEVVWDPFNGSTNPKAIPGATIKYTIIARNQGTANATDLTIKDVIPATTSYCVDSDKSCAAVALLGNDNTSASATGSVTFDADDSEIQGTGIAIAKEQKASIVFFVTVN